MKPGFPNSLLILLSCCLPAAWASPAAAQESGGPDWHFNAFGTLGFAHSDESRADFVFSNLQPKGAGYSRNWDPDIDSRIAAQLTAGFTPSLSAVLQVVSEYRSDNSYQPYVNWANIQYAVTPELNVRFGRIALESFMGSASRQVGYSNPWIRPSTEVYRLLALTNSDGIDIRYRKHVGDVTNSLTLLYGKKTVTNTQGVTVHNTDIWGAYDTLSYGPYSVHLVYQEKHTDNQNPPLGKFTSAGFSYDPGDWLLNAEWVQARNYNANRVLTTREAWNVAAAYRAGAWTPFVSASRLVTLGSGGQSQKTLSAGIRWDIHPHVDLKLQIDHTLLDTKSSGTLQNLQPGFHPGGRFNVVSTALDFAF